MFVSMSLDHVLIIKGRFIKSGYDFVIANVYAPCDVGGHNSLWERLSALIQNDFTSVWCVCGDFNVIRSDSERKSRVSGSRSEEF